MGTLLPVFLEICSFPARLSRHIISCTQAEVMFFVHCRSPCAWHTTAQQMHEESARGRGGNQIQASPCPPTSLCTTSATLNHCCLMTQCPVQRVCGCAWCHRLPPHAPHPCPQFDSTFAELLRGWAGGGARASSNEVGGGFSFLLSPAQHRWTR